MRRDEDKTKGNDHDNPPPPSRTCSAWTLASLSISRFTAWNSSLVGSNPNASSKLPSAGGPSPLCSPCHDSEPCRWLSGEGGRDVSWAGMLGGGEVGE